MKSSQKPQKQRSINRSSLLDTMSSQKALRRKSKRTTMSTIAGTKLKGRKALTKPYAKTRKPRLDLGLCCILALIAIGLGLSAWQGVI